MGENEKKRQELRINAYYSSEELTYLRLKVMNADWPRRFCQF